MHPYQAAGCHSRILGNKCTRDTLSRTCSPAPVHGRLREGREYLIRFFSKPDTSLTCIVDKNDRFPVLAKHGGREPPDIPAIAHDMQGHECDDRVFCTMKTPGKIVPGCVDVLSDISGGTIQNAFVRKVSGGSARGSTPMIVSLRLILNPVIVSVTPTSPNAHFIPCTCLLSMVSSTTR